MTVTVRQLIEERAAGLVGREDERAVLHGLLEADGPVIVFVHGLAGVGKSTLVQAFANEARDRGATVLHLDCRAIEPTERGFLSALGDATGAASPSPAEAASRLDSLGERVVLVLDTYEVFRLFDAWLQQAFVPSLSDGVRVVLSGREPPMTGWESTFGPLFRDLPLGRLPSADAEALLRQSRVDAADAERINRFARGHPLSLRLAASALHNRPDVNIEAVTVQAIVAELTELYLDGLDPMTRQALDAAAVVRRPTVTLLAAMLPDAAPQDAFDRLLRLPFVELSDDGLFLHDTVREAIAAHLRSTDPDRSRRYRAAAWRQLRDEVARASSQEVWRYTADLLYIIQNPIVREAFFPSTEHLYSPEAARPADGAAIAEIVARWEPAASVAVLEAWWRREPTAFRVMRDRSGSVVGFHILAELDHLSHALLDIDPVARRCWDHLRRNPVPRGQRVLFNRCWMARDFGEAPSPVQAACWLDVKGRFMELRPDLRRIYSVVRDIATLGPMVAPLGFVALPGEPSAARRPALLRGRARLRPVVDRRLAVGADRRGAPGRRSGHPRPRRAPARPRREAGRPDGDRVRADVVPLPATRPARRPGRRCCARSGAPTTPAAATSSRCTSARSGASSATDRRRSRRCAGPGTGSCPPPRADPRDGPGGQATGQ